MHEESLVEGEARSGTNAAGELSPELRRRLPERDTQALGAFFDLYFDRVYGYVRRLVQDDAEAEDLTQEVFLHVQRAISTYDPSRELRPWVFTIATNKVRDFWRSRRPHDLFDEDREGPFTGLPSREERADQSLSRQELEGRVRSAVDALPDSMRMTVLLRVYEELSFEEIARIVERTEVAVRKRYSRALEALRSSLDTTWRLHGGEGEEGE